MAPISKNITTTSPAVRTSPKVSTPTRFSNGNCQANADVYLAGHRPDTELENMRLLVRQGGFKGTHCQGTATYQDQASSRLPQGWRVESAEDGVNVYSNCHEVDSSFFVPKRATGTAKPKSSGTDRPRHEPKSSQPTPGVSKAKPSKPKTAKNENLPAKAAADKQ